MEQGLQKEFILYQHLPEMKQLLDLDNILLYIRAGNCLSENDIHKVETAERVNIDKAVHELARLVKKRGKTSLEKFFTALRRSAQEEHHPGHTELLGILDKTLDAVQGPVSEFFPVQEPAERTCVYLVERAAVYANNTSENCEQTDDVTDTVETVEPAAIDGDGIVELIQKPNQEQGTQVVASNKTTWKTICCCTFIYGIMCSLPFLIVVGVVAVSIIGILGLAGRLKCEYSWSVLVNVYNTLLGVLAVASVIIPVGICVFHRYKKKKKRRCCSCVWCVFVTALTTCGGSYILLLFGMMSFTFVTSVNIYSSYDNFSNPPINQTMSCSPAVYYSSFVSITFVYSLMLAAAIFSFGALFYAKVLGQE